MRASKQIAGSIALGLISMSFGYLMRDLVNFGNVEGDVRPAALAKKESTIFERVKSKLSALESIEASTVSGIRDILDSIRKVINEAERLKIIADSEVQQGRYDTALLSLQRIQTKLNDIDEKKIRPFISEIFPKEAADLLFDILEELEEDVKNEISKVSKQVK